MPGVRRRSRRDGDAPRGKRGGVLTAGTSSTYTRAGFVELLDAALASGYEFATFDEATPDRERLCLMRHDVDADLGAAAELARIEERLGVRATFFCMVRSPLYNVFGRANAELVREIASLGHAVGLHYDVGFAPHEGRTHEDAIAVEAAALAELLGIPVRSVSFHQPASNPRVAEIVPSDLVSASSYLTGFDYFSDSNRVDDLEELRRVLASGEPARLHVLVHPLWWAHDEPSASTKDLWDRAILANMERSQRQLLSTERAYGPARRFDVR